MNDILVISERDEIIKVINSICDGNEKVINSSEESVSYLNKNKPAIVILDLEVKDLNIFVAHELLKVCKSINNSIVIVAVSEQTEKETEGYKKLMHPPDEFIKDSEIIINLDSMLKKYTKLPTPGKTEKKTEIEENKPFKDEFDGEISELDIFDNGILEEEDSNQGIFIVEDAQDHSGEYDISIDDSSDIIDEEIYIKEKKKEKKEEKSGQFKKVEEKQEKKEKIKEKQIKKEKIKEEKIREEKIREKSKKENEIDKKNLEKHIHRISELEAENMSLEKQYEFMKNENKELLIRTNNQRKEIEGNKKDIEDNDKKQKKLTEEVEKLKNEQEIIKSENIEDIKKKEKEIEEIKERHDEEIITLNSEVEQVKSDKKILESSLMDEINLLKTNKSDLEKIKDDLSSQIESQKNELSEIEKQLNSEQEEIKNLQNEIKTIEKAKDEKEKILITSIDHLKKNIKTEEEKSTEYKEKLDQITDISKNLSEVVKDIK